MQRQVVTTNGAMTFVGNALGLNKDGTQRQAGNLGKPRHVHHHRHEPAGQSGVAAGHDR